MDYYRDVYTVSLFGHRDIESLRRLENLMVPIIRELIETKPYVSFLIGRNGEFDEYTASLIKLVRKELGTERCDLTLVLPYKVRDIEYYGKYYDSIIIPDSLYNTHYKSAITMRNRWMIENSDYVIVYLEHEHGGAYTAKKYAERLNKKIITVSGKELERAKET